MQSDSNADRAPPSEGASNGCLPMRRLDTPNRPIAIATFVFNTFKEALLYPTVTSYIDRRTGRLIGRYDKKVSDIDDFR